MALITGSTTIDWSSVSLDPIDVQQDFDNFAQRFNDAVSEIQLGNYSLNAPPSPTLLSVTLDSGGIVTATGTGLDPNNPASNPVVKGFEYSTASGDLVSLTGTIDFVGKEVVKRLTIGFPGLQQTIIGNILVDMSSGIASGSITQLQETIGSTQLTLKGSLVISGNFDVSGTITEISVVDGTNTIVMSGLLLPYLALASVTTTDQLFSVVGNLMSGNDTITYTNNSSVGMTFYGGGGNDTITISGPNGDTLNGGAGNDTLNGGVGDDTLNGGDGNDIILIGAAAEHGAGETIDGGAGSDVLRFTTTTANETLALNATVTGVERVVIGTAAGLTTGTTALNVDASNVTTALSIIGNNGANTLTGTDFNDVLNGGGGDDTLNGGVGNDTLIGGAGNDTLNGGAGNNTLLGGTGNDTYIVDASPNLVIEGLTAGTDTVVASLDYTLTANVENLELTGSALTGTGNALANTITGTSGADTLFGLAGNDILSGGAGQDTVDGGVGNDVVVMEVTTDDGDVTHGGTGTDTLALIGAVDGDGVVVADLSVADQVVSIGGAADALLQDGFENLDASGLGLGSSVNVTGSAGANLLIGSNGADTLNGGLGNDTLNGGAGDDTLNSGDGNDVILIGNAADYGAGEVIDGGAGMDVLRFTSITANETLALNATVTAVERVVIGTAAGLTTGTTALNVDASNVTTALSIIGNNGANTLTGTDFNDVLNGGGGDDTLNGGVGNDTLIGGAGNDTLNGGAGNNTLLGGTGNDTYIVDASPNLVIEGLTAGTDTVVASLDYTLTANVENLELTGSALTGTGNALANTITGTSGADTLFGLAGNDILSGGAGQDTVDGGVGNDVIVMEVTTDDGDVTHGGTGTDTLALIGAVDGDGVVVADLSVADQVVSIGGAADALLQDGFENLDASGLGLGSSVNVTGSAGANLLIGSNGADTLNGGLGNDTLNGGAGDDTLNSGDGNDVILIGNAADYGAGEVIDGGAGMDVLRFTSITAGQTLILASGVTAVESVVIATGAGLTTGTTALNVDASALSSGLLITGNAGANELTGTDDNDILNGGAGNDTLTGGAGNDTLIGGAGNDTLNGGAGNNTLLGGTGNDTYIVDASPNLVIEGLTAGTDTVVASLDYTLTANVENLELTGSALTGTGNALANTITGTSGADTLFGLAGNDILSGGAGQDTVDGGVGNDVVVMEVTTDDGDVTHGGTGTDTLALIGAVDGDGVVVADLSVADQVVSIGGAADALLQDGFENLDASGLGLGSSVNVTGSAGANLLIGSNGADTLNGGLGNDTLNGGAGDDTLNSGDGNDVILIGNAADYGAGEVIDGGAGMDVLRFTSITANETLALNATVTAVERVVIGTAAGLTTGTTALNVDASALSSGLVITGNAGANTLTGTDFNDVLNGGGGDDTLTGGAGNDTLIGGAGSDTFLFSIGDGQDLIQDSSGSADKVLFDGGIDPLDLVISRQANNLRLAIHGSSDQITVQNWYTSSANRTETIQAGNGEVLHSTQVNQLIQAMAQFTTDTGLSWDNAIDGGGTGQQQAQFQGIIAASWQ